MKNHQIDHKSHSQKIDVTAPWQAPIDHKAMQRVEQRVIKQLIQALLYENIIEFDYENAASIDDDTLLDFTIKTANHIHYQAQGYIHYSFDIIRFNDHNVQRVIDGKSHDATLENVISDILLKIEEATLKDNFIKELRHTLINETQAQRLSPHLSIPNMPAAIDRLTYEQLEGYLMAGHPYHPCFKSRIGFDLQDNYDYGPEFDQNIEVVWLAVKKDLLVSNTAANIDIDEWIKDYVDMDKFAALHDKLNHILTTTSEQSENEAIVANANIDVKANAYGLIPAHPWQWQNTLILALQPLIKTQDVIYLGSTGNQYRAQQSIRSLSMLQEDKAYLKLSMHLMNTSSTRILAKHTVMNAAIVTKWLNQLVAEDATAQALSIAFLGETVGISLDHEVLQERGYQNPHIYGGLGAIWRENVSGYLSSNQTAFPLNGVSYVNTDDSILIDPWIRKYGIEAWTAQLIKVTVAPILHLLFGHGVALECHAQNIVLVHEAGFPIKVLLKDLHDGVRYSPKHLTRQELIPNFHSLPAVHAALNRGSFIETDDTDGIRDMTVACLFFVAFADIAIFMQTHYHYPETEFWQQVSDCVTEYQSRHPEHEARFELFDVFAPQTRIESLAKRRLFGDQVFPIKYINNPLAKRRAHASC